MPDFVVIECKGKADPVCRTSCPFWSQSIELYEICLLGKIDDHIYPDFDLDWALEETK